jgi:hypothetical protein
MAATDVEMTLADANTTAAVLNMAKADVNMAAGSFKHCGKGQAKK